MIIVNTEYIPGMRIAELKGLVQGNTIRAKNVGRDIMAGLKNLVGGELKGYAELLTEARRVARRVSWYVLDRRTRRERRRQRTLQHQLRHARRRRALLLWHRRRRRAGSLVPWQPSSPYSPT